MVYKVIGLMSGSSLDGLDIAYVQLEEVRGNWSCNILNAECVPYSDEWQMQLKNAANESVGNFLRLHTAYGKYLGETVKQFIERYELGHKVHFVSSHGHTAFHEPNNSTTFQLGEGAAIASVLGLPVINDLRAMDVAYAGQGAPIVPIGDKMLFSDCHYLLNIGGIANVTIQGDAQSMAFDVCPANQILNSLANRVGQKMDEGGALARSGRPLPGTLELLNNLTYYGNVPPKSLSNDAVGDMMSLVLNDNDSAVADLLHTMCIHIAGKIAKDVIRYGVVKEGATMLVTGGGALNTFLIECLQNALDNSGINVVVPDEEIVTFKEAMVMALIGTLRWREEVNVLASVTGANRDSIGGALWLP